MCVMQRRWAPVFALFGALTCMLLLLTTTALCEMLRRHAEG